MDAVLRPDNDGNGGGDDVGRYGHGLGIQLTEPPSHTHWDNKVLTANMALTLEPSLIYDDGFLMVAEENILITESGVDLLSTRAARDLPVIV
jgi:Xaa-Pro aminopeptidase